MCVCRKGRVGLVCLVRIGQGDRRDFFRFRLNIEIGGVLTRVLSLRRLNLFATLKLCSMEN